MSYKPALGIASISLFLGAAISLEAQPRPYNIIGPPGTPESIAKTERLREVLSDGWKVKPADAVPLEAELSRNPENLALRLRLISYYTQFLLDEPRFRHIFWLIENHPDVDAFQDGGILTRINTGSPESARAKALWQRQASRFSTNPKVLSNAATALADDPGSALQFVRAARAADAANPEWTRWLAKTYADAVRWSFWDGRSHMTFTGDAEDFRHIRFSLSLPACQSMKKEMETSADAGLVRATGEALLREVRLLRARGGDVGAAPDLPQAAQFGEALLGRAKALESR